MFSSDELVQKKHYNNRVESELAHDVEEYTDKDLVSTKEQGSQPGEDAPLPLTIPPLTLSTSSYFARSAESVLKCKLLLFLTHSIFTAWCKKFFPLFEIPASFLPSKMASPCTANWP